MAEAPPVSQASAAPRRAGRRSFGLGLGLSYRLGLVLCGLYVALLVNGRLPGLSNGLISTVISEGDIACVAQHHVLVNKCADSGLPVGRAFSDGLAMNLLGGLFAQLPQIDPHRAFLLTCAALFGLSIYGFIAVLRRFDVGFTVACLAGVLYLISPTIIGLGGFGGTLFGFALLPAMLAADLRVLDLLAGSGLPRRVLLILGWSAIKSGLLLMDGYAFIVCALLDGCLVLTYLAGAFRAGSQPEDDVGQLPATETARTDLANGNRPRTRVTIAGMRVLSFLIAHAVAYETYQRVIPGGSAFLKDPPSVFRAMGADVVSFVLPSPTLWWRGQLHPGQRLYNLWGDSSNSYWNYVGLGCLVLACAGAIMSRQHRLTWPLLAAAIIALVLSLGPSLKFADVRPLPAPGQPENLYFMNAGQAVFGLPTAPLFAHLPGVDVMRATYRWFGATRLVLILFAAVGVQRLFAGAGATRSGHPAHRRRRQAAVGVLVLFSVLELLPAPGRIVAQYQVVDRYRRDLKQLAASLDDALPSAARVVFAPLLAPGVYPNDYLSAYLVPLGHYRSYNVAGDKSVNRLLQVWPSDIRNLILGKSPVSSAKHAFAAGSVDAVVVPNFDLRLLPAQWPSPAGFRKLGQKLANQFAADPALTVKRYYSFAIVTPATR